MDKKTETQTGFINRYFLGTMTRLPVAKQVTVFTEIHWQRLALTATAQPQLSVAFYVETL